MSFNTFIRVGGGFPTGRSIGGGRDKSGPTGCLTRSRYPGYFVKEHNETLLRWLRMFLRSIRIAVRIMNSCLFKITRRAQACNWNFWLACAGDLLGQRFPNRGRSLKACAIATKYGVEILVTRDRPK